MYGKPTEPTIEERLTALEAIVEIALAIAVQNSPHGKANLDGAMEFLDRKLYTGLTASDQLVEQCIQRVSDLVFPDEK